MNEVVSAGEGIRDDQHRGGHGCPRSEFRLIDLFCGAGGLTEGFVNGHPGRFESVWANDFNEDAAKTYNRRFGDHCVHGDIVSILENPDTQIPEADIVIGGPPCQGFSLLNKNREGDPRKELWRPYLEVVRRSGANTFVMENVPQLLSSIELDDILAHARGMGFVHVAKGLLRAADYGVPQTRVRAIIIASRDGDPNDVFPPLKTHYNPNKPPSLMELADYVQEPQPWVTVRDAIGDLPPPIGTEIRHDVPHPLDLHFGRNPTATSMARYRAIPKEGMNREDLLRNAPELTPRCWVDKKGGTDLFGRLWWDRPAFTIRTEFYKPEKGRYLHPEQHRAITHREAARFQSFPNDFEFVGSKVEIARQIGNAVPPLLGKAVAGAVLQLLGAQVR
jgi:DNA (cytosine-5)-methyltransferase 1